MKLLKSTKWPVLFLAAFLTFGLTTMAWAQTEEDGDDEPVQARPNPMERTSSMQRGTNAQKGAQMQTQQQAGQQMSNKAKAGALKGQAVHPGAMHQTPGAMK